MQRNSTQEKRKQVVQLKIELLIAAKLHGAEERHKTTDSETLVSVSDFTVYCVRIS